MGVMGLVAAVHARTFRPRGERRRTICCLPVPFRLASPLEFAGLIVSDLEGVTIKQLSTAFNPAVAIPLIAISG